MRTRPHRHARLALVAIAIAFAASACGSSATTWAPPSGARTAPPSAGTASASTGASAGPDASADRATYAAIESQVEALRGLTHTTTVSPVLLDSKGVSDWLTKAFAEQVDHQALADESRLFVHLGLLPAGSSLEQMELALESSQVVGFYDSTSKGLYVLSQSGGVGPTEKITFSHEYTHALQDQNFGLDKLATDTADQGDRDLARTALLEGDATQLMTQWATAHMSLPDLLLAQGEALQGGQTDQLSKAPPILRESLLFPYQDGLSFVSSIYAAGGWAAVNKVYADPPDSTSQILHPELYAQHVKPVALTVPAVPASLPGWKLTMQDTLGELQLRIWLEGDAAEGSLSAAVDQWAGDRIALYEGPNGEWAVVLKTEWRTAAGATAFAAALPARLKALGPSRQCPASTRVDVAIASSQTVIPDLLTCAA